jgi:hypothetical protein
MAEPKPKAKGITLKLGPAVKVERIEAPPPAPQELAVDISAVVPQARTLFGQKPAAPAPKPTAVVLTTGAVVTDVDIVKAMLTQFVLSLEP